MYRLAEARLARFFDSGVQHILKDSRVGLEKESLRVTPQGGIAQTPHPLALGSALTHPRITTDYSEALLEFITPPFTDLRESLHCLRELQGFVYRNLGEEILWATSMPCVLAGEQSVPIAQYGRSNIGKMKTVYRRGLGHRYGRVMQVIAGVHFNYSPPEALWPLYAEQEASAGRPVPAALRDFTSHSYFGMIRNLQRFGWLVPYLFGASPAVCKSFLAGQPTDMAEFDRHTYYEPYATSLRLGDIGYQNRQEDEAGVKACYDDLDAYVETLTRATQTPCPLYEKIGVVADGEYRQLNANILQIENEYYSSVRPKQLLTDNEKPALALKRRGVAYIELRSLDVNAFEPLGVDEVQLRFLEAFMVFCLLHDSPPISRLEREEIDWNLNAAAHRGREPGLRLQRQGRAVPLLGWAAELCDAMQGVCDLLDRGQAHRPYARALAEQREAVRDPERTPSARMLAAMRAAGEGFFQFAMRLSRQHREYFAHWPLAPEREQALRQEAQESLLRQRALEAADTLEFDEYLRRYFAQSLDSSAS